VIEVYESVPRPKSLPQVFSCDYFGGLFQEHCENLKWLILQPDSAAVLEKFSGTEVHFEGTEPYKAD